MSPLFKLHRYLFGPSCCPKYSLLWPTGINPLLEIVPDKRRFHHLVWGISRRVCRRLLEAAGPSLEDATHKTNVLRVKARCRVLRPELALIHTETGGDSPTTDEWRRPHPKWLSAANARRTRTTHDGLFDRILPLFASLCAICLHFCTHPLIRM